MVAICKLKQPDNPEAINPTFAIVFYGTKSGSTFAVRHRVEANNTLSLGTVISAAKVREEVLNLQTGTPSTAILPASVLIDSPTMMVWHKPRFVETMWFRTDETVKGVKVEWPPLLFLVDKTAARMRVFALPSNARPGPSTRLYHAPLMNVYEGGYLCQGTAKLPSKLSTESIPLCEESLIASQFTHTNHAQTIRGRSDDAAHVAFWKKKAARQGRKPGRVSVSELHFSGNTFGTLLEEITNG